jgi:hypothetical protein
VGRGWLIFKPSPTEAAVHAQMDKNSAQRHVGHELLGAVLYLMCDDLLCTIGPCPRSPGRLPNLLPPR